MPILSSSIYPTVADVKTHVAAKGYSITDADYITLIEQAHREILAARRWPFLDTISQSVMITAGEDSVSLDAVADLLHVDAVRIENGSESYSLVPTDGEDVRRWLNDDRANGPMEYWARRGSFLYVYPRPDADRLLEIDYSASPEPLGATGDYLLIPTLYMDTVVWHVVAQIAYRQRDRVSGDWAEGKRDAALQRMAAAYSIKDRQQSTQVKPYWGRRR